MMLIRWIWFRLILLAVLFSYFYSQQIHASTKPVFNIIKIDTSININGKLDNPAWKLADPIEVNYEINPGDNLPASERTVVRALYNEEYLYFGYQCYDSKPEEIRANYSERDRIFSDDYVIIILDTYNDAQKAYEIAVNPYGIQGDLMATYNGEDINFNMTWYAASAINDSGWTAEMAIPFKSLAFDDSEEPVWGFNVVRTIPRSSRTQISWTPIDKNLPGFISQSGILKGLKNITSSASFELLPYVIGQNTSSLADHENPASNFNNKGIAGRIGGGIKYSPSPDFSLDAVINPDFSQIEADAEQISVNETFALYYDEKRPFFLIGNELLQSGVYHSRSINNPLVASRIMGKSGSLSYLFLGALDRNTVFVIPGEEGSNTVETDKNSFASIGRVRYDYGDEDYIGSYIMTRNMSEGNNYVFGIDGSYKFWRNWLFHTQLYFTRTNELNDSSLVDTERDFGSTKYSPELDGETYHGSGLHFLLSHSQKHYYMQIESNHVDPTFQSHNGLFSTINQRTFDFYNSYRIYPDSSFIDRVNFNLSYYIQFNFDGIRKNLSLSPSIYFAMKGQTYLYLQYHALRNENFKRKTFKNINSVYMELNTKPLKELSFGLYISAGKFLHRSDEPSIGNGHNLGGYITLKPTSKFNLEISYDRARLSDKKTDELFYDGNIYRTTAIYQHNAEIFFRTIFQYNSFEKTFRVYPLFSYKLGAFTTFYVGASSNYKNYRAEHAVKNTDRQYFVKLQYLVSL